MKLMHFKTLHFIDIIIFYYKSIKQVKMRNNISNSPALSAFQTEAPASRPALASTGKLGRPRIQDEDKVPKKGISYLIPEALYNDFVDACYRKGRRKQVQVIMELMQEYINRH